MDTVYEEASTVYARFREGEMVFGLTIAEEVVLIALDEETGCGLTRPGLDWALAGSIIVELVLAQRISVGDGDVITLVDSTPTGIAHMDIVLAEAESAAKVPQLLRRARQGVSGYTVSALVDRGLVQPKRGWLLGVIPVYRYPSGDVSTKYAVRDLLVETVLKGHVPSDRTAALIGVLYAANLWRRSVPTGRRFRVRRRMGEIAKGQGMDPTVRKTISRTKSAVATTAAPS